MVGTSGSGKSTVLRMINRLVDALGRPGPDRRRGHRFRARARAAPAHRLRHPGPRAVPAPDGGREHRDGSGPARLAQGPDRRPGRGAAGRVPARSRRVRPQVPAPALGRPAAARRRRPGARRRAQHPAHGRAVRCPGRDHPRPRPGGPPGDPAPVQDHDRPGHPRHGGGVPPRRPDRRARARGGCCSTTGPAALAARAGRRFRGAPHRCRRQGLPAPVADHGRRGRPSPARPTETPLPAGTTLRDALAQLVWSGVEALPVAADDGAPLGPRHHAPPSSPAGRNA